MNSFHNFLWDMFVKSFECKHAVIESLERVSEPKNMIEELYDEKELELWRNIYEERIQNILNNVKIVTNSGSNRIDHVSFHKKFGWIVSSGDFKAYLGKTSLINDLKVAIGHRSYFSAHGLLKGPGFLTIGNYCSIAEGVYVTAYADFHPMQFASTFNFKMNERIREDNRSMPLRYDNLFEKAKVGITLGSDVWIGRNVRLSHGIKIGHGCVIAEGSLVRKDCEPYGIYAGFPAKLIRYRFNQTIIDKLLKIKWWNFPEDTIRKNLNFFDQNLFLNDVLEFKD